MQRETRSRALALEETEVLRRLLAFDFPGATELRDQLPFALVVGPCACGCVSVDISVDATRAPAAAGAVSPLPVEVEIVGSDGACIGGIIVFLTDGYVSLIDVHSYGDDPISTWPSMDALTFRARR